MHQAPPGFLWLGLLCDDCGSGYGFHKWWAWESGTRRQRGLADLSGGTGVKTLENVLLGESCGLESTGSGVEFREII